MNELKELQSAKAEDAQSNTTVNRKRSSEVLNLLKTHGMLSTVGLNLMTQPRMSKKKLSRLLGNLVKKEIVIAHRDHLSRTFYQINQSIFNRESVARKLACSSAELVAPLVRKQNWVHNEWAEYWIHQFKNLYPDSKVVREDEISKDEESQECLLLSAGEYEFVPDFLVFLAANQEQTKISIAVEIERTRKSNSRITRKLDWYASRTKIDGLIYICDKGRLIETIRDLYRTRVVAKSFRISHYGQNFFLFSSELEAVNSIEKMFLNASAAEVNLCTWISILRNSKRTLRRDAKFENGVLVTPKNQDSEPALNA